MLFKKEFMQEVVYDEAEGVAIMEDIIVEHRRWSVVHRIIFSYQEKLYESNYCVGATESQDERPYEWEDDEIKCSEVKPVSKTITVYEKI